MLYVIREVKSLAGIQNQVCTGVTKATKINTLKVLVSLVFQGNFKQFDSNSLKEVISNLC